MEDEVLESAISQMTIDTETGGLDSVVRHSDVATADSVIEEITTHSAPEEDFRYSDEIIIEDAIRLLQSGSWEIIHEEQHPSGAYIVAIGAVGVEIPMEPITLIVGLEGSNRLHDAQNTEDAPVEIDEQGEA